MKLKQIRIKEVLVAIKSLYLYLTAVTVLSKAISVILSSAIAMGKVMKNEELTILI